jgi:hypothetical protein
MLETSSLSCAGPGRQMGYAHHGNEQLIQAQRGAGHQALAAGDDHDQRQEEETDGPSAAYASTLARAPTCCRTQSDHRVRPALARVTLLEAIPAEALHPLTDGASNLKNSPGLRGRAASAA